MAEYTQCILKRIGNENASEICIEKNTYTCGRTAENKIVCQSKTVSKKHCVFFRCENDISVQDLKSANGTFVNGKRIPPFFMQLLNDGDVVGIGRSEVDSKDSSIFVYQLQKQVVIDLERECVKREISSEGEEEYIPPNKFLKLSGSEKSSRSSGSEKSLRLGGSEKSAGAVVVASKAQLNDFMHPIPKNRTPTMRSGPSTSSDNSASISVEIKISRSNSGPMSAMPNIFFNQMPSSHFPRSVTYQFPASTSFNSANNLYINSPQNDDVVIVSDDNVDLSSKSPVEPFQENKNSTGNSNFIVTEISCRNNFSEDVPSSSEKQISTPYTTTKRLKELVQQEKPDSTSDLKSNEKTAEDGESVDESEDSNKNESLKSRVSKIVARKLSRETSENEQENPVLVDNQSSEAEVLVEKKNLEKETRIPQTVSKISRRISKSIEKSSESIDCHNSEAVSMEKNNLEADSDSDESFMLYVSDADDDSVENLSISLSNNEINQLHDANKVFNLIEEIMVPSEVESTTTSKTTEQEAIMSCSLENTLTSVTECPMDLDFSEEDLLQISSSFISEQNLTDFNLNLINDVENETSYRNCQDSYPAFPVSYQQNQNFDQNCRYPAPVYPNACPNPQDFYPDFRYPPPAYQNQMVNCPSPFFMQPPAYIPPLQHQNEQTVPPPTMVPPPSPIDRDPRLNRSQSYIDYSSGKSNFETKKSVPTIIRSERVNLPYQSNARKTDVLAASKSRTKQESLHLPALPMQDERNNNSLQTNGSRMQIEGNNNSRIDTMFEKDAKRTVLIDNKLVEIRTYVPKNSLYRSNAKSDEVLMNIVSWKPAEFESCFSQDIPHVLDEKKLKKTKTFYDNHDDYCKTMIPLILLNVSYKIKDAYKSTQKNTKFTNCEVVKGSALMIWLEETDSYMMGFQIKLFEIKLNAFKLPVVGDFLRIEITKGKTNFKTLMFAYVAKVFDSESEQNQTDPDFMTITFEVVTKLFEFNLYESKIREISKKISLLPSINLVKALDNLKNSPILPMILNPDPEDYLVGPNLSSDAKKLLGTSLTSHLLGKEDLNYTQLSAVRRIADEAARRELKVALIEGSPGTGKTKVLTNLIIDILSNRNAIQEKVHPMKILVCAENDCQVDEILHRIRDRIYDRKNKESADKLLVNMKMVRVGHPDEMSRRAKDFSLQELARKHVDKNLEDCIPQDSSTTFEQQLVSILQQINSIKEAIPNKKNPNAVLKLAILTTYLDIKKSGRQLDDIYPLEYRHLIELAEQVYLLGANVIVCTLDTCNSPRMDQAFRNENSIPVLIVEDATQTIECEIFKALTFGVKTLVLAGDANKRSTKYIDLHTLENLGFNESLFSRLKRKLSDANDWLIFKLKTQYRMSRKIAYFPNNFFYEGKLRNIVESGKTFPLYSYRMFNLMDANPEKHEVTFVSNLVMCIMLYAEFKNFPKPLKVGIVATSKSSSFEISKAITEQLELISEEKKNCIVLDVDTIPNFSNQERDIIFAFCSKPENGRRIIGMQKLYNTITLAKHSLILYGAFNKFPDEKTSIWNALVEDGIARRMLVNIDIRDSHHSKLKKHVLRAEHPIHPKNQI